MQPVTYVNDECTYLQKRWAPEGSKPGTIVVPIMFHSIAKNGTTIADKSKDITGGQFLEFVNTARYYGFETITTQQLLGFLQDNGYIPPLSMMIIVDDRRPGTIKEWIMPELEASNWTVTSAYIADPNDLDWAWNMMGELFSTGRLDVQSHGYSGKIYITSETPVEDIKSEIWDSTPVLEEHFGTRPTAFIWPGGNFTAQSVEIAREGGYQLGFTAFSRGPLMYDWIPQGEKELAVGDPLMLLPRAWSSAANYNLYEATLISEQARNFAEQNFDTEAQWYRTYCGGEISQGK